MIYKSPKCFLPSFESTGLSVQEKKQKIDFQDGCHSPHPGFTIGMILAIFDLQVIPMLPTKFGVKWPFGSGEDLIVLGFNDTSTLEGHFVSSPREREKRDRRESRGDEREGQGRKRNRNESEETEEIKTFPLYPYPLQG